MVQQQQYGGDHVQLANQMSQCLHANCPCSYTCCCFINTIACPPTNYSLVKLQLLKGLLAHIRTGVDHHCAAGSFVTILAANVQSGQWNVQPLLFRVLDVDEIDDPTDHSLVTLQLIKPLVAHIRTSVDHHELVTDKDIITKVSRKFSNMRDTLRSASEKEQAAAAVLLQQKVAELQAQIAAAGGTTLPSDVLSGQRQLDGQR